MSQDRKPTTTSNAVSFPQICSTPDVGETRNLRARRASNKSNQKQTFAKNN